MVCIDNIGAGGEKKERTEGKVCIHEYLDLVYTVILLIAPYNSNVTIIERWIQEKLEYSVLRRVAPPTVESYQGRETDIVRVVLGTPNNLDRVSHVRWTA